MGLCSFFSFFKKTNNEPQTLKCQRIDCSNDSTRTILEGEFRICDSCFKEIMDYKKVYWSGKKTRADVRERIVGYMKDIKPGELYPNLSEDLVNEEFNRLMGNEDK
jgi:hypothetical protein